MARYVAQVPLRWTDQDSYRHLNHARAVTVLEEARVEMFFAAAAAEGVKTFSDGLLVAALSVEYKRQIPYRGLPLRVAMTVDEIRAASFVISYDLHEGPDEHAPVAVVASTRMAMYDLVGGRPRRLTAEERAFLERWEPVS